MDEPKSEEDRTKEELYWLEWDVTLKEKKLNEIEKKERSKREEERKYAKAYREEFGKRVYRKV